MLDWPPWCALISVNTVVKQLNKDKGQLHSHRDNSYFKEFCNPFCRNKANVVPIKNCKICRYPNNCKWTWIISLAKFKNKYILTCYYNCNLKFVVVFYAFRISFQWVLHLPYVSWKVLKNVRDMERIHGADLLHRLKYSTFKCGFDL